MSAPLISLSGAEAVRYSCADEYCFNRVPKAVNFRSGVRGGGGDSHNVGVSPTSSEASSERAPCADKSF